MLNYNTGISFVSVKIEELQWSVRSGTRLLPQHFYVPLLCSFAVLTSSGAQWVAEMWHRKEAEVREKDLQR